MPVIPFAATVGTWLGATAATAATVGGTAILAGAGIAGGAYAVGSNMAANAGSKDSESIGAITPMESIASGENTTGAVTPESVETQAAQRRLARLSKYFTSPTGVLDDVSVGKTGVFS